MTKGPAMRLYVKNRSRHPIYVTVDPGRPGTKRIVLYITSEKLPFRHHLLEALLTTPVLIEIPGFTDLQRLKLVNAENFIYSVDQDADGDKVLSITAPPELPN